MAQLSPRAIQHGQHIFVYNNIRTNQVIYSLTRTLNNNASLAQLPNLGKKTIPPSLRKDLWLPLATLTFPSPSLGLTAYRKLREFRKLHETAYPVSAITRTEGKNKGTLMGRKGRAKVLMDQKANSVADMAAVLLGQAREVVVVVEEGEERGGGGKEGGNGKRKGRRKGEVVKRDRDRDGEGREVRGVQGVRIAWSNILDAQFAQTWPASVVHGDLRTERYTAADPRVEVAEMGPGAEAVAA